MDITSTEKIIVGTREFDSIQSLWKSTFPVGLEKELIGDRNFWYDECIVMFPGKDHSSAAMIEIHQGIKVLVGTCANYVTFTFTSRQKAIKEAEKINKEWLEFTGTADQFVDKITEQKIKALKKKMV